METQESAETTLVQDLSLPLFKSKGWMKLVAVLSIIYGAAAAITVVGLIIAWLPIWMGVILYQSATSVEQAMGAGDKEALFRSLAKLKTYFTILGVLSLIGLVLAAVGLLTGHLFAPHLTPESMPH